MSCCVSENLIFGCWEIKCVGLEVLIYLTRPVHPRTMKPLTTGPAHLPVHLPRPFEARFLIGRYGLPAASHLGSSTMSPEQWQVIRGCVLRGS